MSCKGCGGSWEGSAAYCPNCAPRHIFYPSSQMEWKPQMRDDALLLGKLDEIAHTLRDIHLELCRQRLQGR